MQPIHQTEHLFILSHAGETRALKDVIEIIEKKGQNYRILYMAMARTIVTAEFPETLRNKSIDINSLGMSKVIDKNWQATDILSAEDIVKITQAVHAKNVYLGVALTALGQLAEEYKKFSHVTAYWDNWNASSTGTYFEVARNVEKVAHATIFPSTYTAKQFPHRNPTNSFVGGKPSFEKTLHDIQNGSKEPVYQALQISEDTKPIAWMGGYGPKYNTAFKLFVKMMLDQSKPVTVILRPHPNATENVEKQAMEEFKGHNVHWVFSDPKGAVITNQVLSVADMVCTYESTVGFDALAAKKKVVYIIPEGDPFTNIELNYGIARKASDLHSWNQAASQKETDIPDLFEIVGIPKNSAELIANFITRQK